MRTRKCLFIILFFIQLFGVSHLLYSQPNTLYFMKGIPQTKDINPARPGITGGFYFSMPLFSKLDLSANTNNWSYNDLIHKGIDNTLNNNVQANHAFWNQSDSLVVDINKFLGSIGTKNFVQESAALTVLEGGYKKGKNFYAVSLTEREFAEVSFHKSLINLLVFGNYQYVGRTYFSGNLNVNTQHYREFAFNYSHDVDNKLTIGAAAKILFGMGVIQSNGVNLIAATPVNGESMDVKINGRVNVSAPVQFNTNPSGEISSINSLPNYTPSDYFSNFGNPGIAIDLGFAYRVNKKTELSVSVIDLGMIAWKTNVTRLTENGNFLYKGINLNTAQPVPLNSLINAVSDSITATFKPTITHSSFSTLIPTKIYFGVDYQLNDIISLAGLSRIRIINSTIHTSLTASANAYVLNGLSLSASYSIMESTFDNLGLGVGIKAGPFQIYTAADNLFSPFYPSKARNMNLRIGINFIFGDGDNGNAGKSGSSSYPNCHCPY